MGDNIAAEFAHHVNRDVWEGRSQSRSRDVV